MKTRKFTKLTAVILVIVLSLVLFTSCTLASVLTQLFGSKLDADQRAEYILSTVYEEIKNNYVKELTDEELEALVAQGAGAMLAYYDDYGYFLTPSQYYDLMQPTASDNDGDYYGFTFVQQPYLGLVVHSVITDSKSYGKLFVGDVIIEITKADGSPLTYQSEGKTKTVKPKVTDSDTILSALNNQRDILVTVIRGGTAENAYDDGYTVTLTVSKGPIDDSHAQGMEYVEYYFGLDNNNLSPATINLRNLADLDATDIGYIRIVSFSYTYDERIEEVLTDTKSEIKTALDRMKASGKTKLILDLKGNPGGSVDQVCGVASYFVYDQAQAGKDLLVTTLVDRSASETCKTKSNFGTYFDTAAPGEQIVVVTDGGSASASELLLGAMLDYGTATHIGTTTFGKGIAQYIKPILKANFVRDGQVIPSYYGIYYTAAYYYTPSGKNIHKVGYTPQEQNIAPDYDDVIERAKQILD